MARRPPSWAVTLFFVPILVLFPFVYFATYQPGFFVRYWVLFLLLFGVPWAAAGALWWRGHRKSLERPAGPTH
jgi:hypothetical protein